MQVLIYGSTPLVHRALHSRATLPLLILVQLLAAGCGQPSASLDGRVLVDHCPQRQLLAANDPTCAALAPDCLAIAPQFATSNFFSGAAEASLRLQPGQRTTTTTEQGHFSLAGLPSGRHALAVNVADTVLLRRIVTVDLSPDSTTDGSRATPLNITFSAAGRLEGFVLPPTGEPPEDLLVQESLAGIAVRLQCPPRTATTRTDGFFSFDNVQQGRQHLNATGIGLLGRAAGAAGTGIAVLRGRTARVDLQLSYGYVADEPTNRAPRIPQDIALELAAPLADAAELVLPAVASGFVSGQVIRATCTAEDDDGDTVQLVWTASSGELGASRGNNTLLTLGDEDVGLSCTALDGRGGSSQRHTVVRVLRPYFAGATLLGADSSAVLFANGYGADFDLVLHSKGPGAGRQARADDQWLPTARGDAVAFVERRGQQDRLIRVLPAAASGVTVAQAPTGQAIAAHHFALTDGGLVYVDHRTKQIVHLAHPDSGGAVTIIGPLGAAAGELEDRIAAHGSSFVVVRQDGEFALYRDDNLLNPLLFSTVGRRPLTSFATNGSRVVYFDPAPVLALPATAAANEPPIRLGDDITIGGRRILFDGDLVAYSAFIGPTRFKEPTIVRLSGGPQASGPGIRAARGAAQVLDLRGTWLLFGRPRMLDREPASELRLIDLKALPGVL